MQRIKILYTIPNFDTAGSQYVVKALYEHIDGTVFDPFIGVESGIDLIPKTVPHNRRVLIPSGNAGMKRVFSLRKLLKTNKIDILHSWDYKSQSIEAIACRLAGVKYLFTKKNNSWSKRWFLKSMLAHHIAYDNPSMKQRFFSSRPLNSKVTFIPHGVDTRVFFPKPKPEKSTFDVCCIGTITQNKNQLFLIEAMKDLPEKVHLYLYGKEEPEYAGSLKARTQVLQLEQRVHFMGFLENDMIPKVLNNHHIFVLASKNEGLPLSLLEALACGRPVLSSDSGGGSRYLLEKTGGGKLFSTATTGGLVKEISSLMNDSIYYLKLSEQAHKNTQTYFNLQLELDRYKSLYLKLANAGF